MSRIFLQEMVDDIRFDGLPVNWNTFEFGKFSRGKKLCDYQLVLAFLDTKGWKLGRRYAWGLLG